jgi:hypothetical protein
LPASTTSSGKRAPGIKSLFASFSSEKEESSSSEEKKTFVFLPPPALGRGVGWGNEGER